MATMKMVPIKKAKDQLTTLARDVERGEHVLITRNGKPVMEWIPVRSKGGLNFDALLRWKAERGVDQIVEFIADDFDDPLPEDFLIAPGS